MYVPDRPSKARAFYHWRQRRDTRRPFFHHREGLFMSERTVSTAQRGRMLASTIGKPVLFAVLMWLASAAGEISIPGTPGADHAADLRHDAGRSDAQLASGRQRGGAVSGRRRGRAAGVRRRRLHRRPVRPERGLPDRLPAGRNRHRPAARQGASWTRLRTPR